MTRIICLECGYRTTVTTDVPERCPRCMGRRWESLDGSKPKHPYLLSKTDKAFLGTMHINQGDSRDDE
jgi:hypothetical protein